MAKAPVAYPAALARMDAYADALAKGETKQPLIWLLEHPPLLTAGTSAKPSDLLDDGALPVFSSGRGGQYTYHGPGQRVVYIMLPLDDWRRDVRAYVNTLEQWIINILADYAIKGERRPHRVGVWVNHPPSRANPIISESKIAAIGVRVRRYVTMHGFAINRDPDLTAYRLINPCGLSDKEFGVTSLAALGANTDSNLLDQRIRAHYYPLFS